MENLPKPPDGIRPRVPFEAECRIYTPQDFVTLPKGHGYEDLDQLVQRGLNPSMDPKVANAFVQEWLFFGLLSRVLDEDVNSHDFLNSHSRTLHTSKHILEKKIDEWRQREAPVDGQTCDVAQRRYIRASDALAIARRFTAKHLSYKLQDDDNGRPGHRHDAFQKPRNAAHDAIDTRITLSIAILGEIIQRERPVPVTLPSTDRQDFWQDPSLEPKGWGYSKYCRDQLQNNNWCPSEIRRLESTLPGVCEVYYCSSSKPRRSLDHSDCTWDNCNAPFLEVLDHVEGECEGECGSPLGLYDDEVARVIMNNKTPLITYDRTKGRLILHELDLRGDPPMRFGALSHAWEDKILAMGEDAAGRNDRRILQCRVRKMQNDFNKLVYGKDHTRQDEDVPFYVDVICYPRQVRAQALALNQMRLVYSKASEVLVWDRDLLREKKPSDSRLLEMNVKIRLGNWTKSLWTLFEAVLARNITVALSDETITFEELEKARREAKRDLYHEYHHVCRAGQPFSEAVYQLRKLDLQDDPKYRSQKVWNAVQFKKIDKVQNEAPILAALMGLDVNSLVTELEIPVTAAAQTREEHCNRLASTQMVKLLNLMNQTPGLGIPSGLIFLPGPKVRHHDHPETRQYSWAPRTWLTRQAHPRSLTQPLRSVAITHANGLLVNLPGFELDTAVLPLVHHIFWVPVAHTMQEWYTIEAYPETSDFEAWWMEVTQDCSLMVVLADASPGDHGTVGLLVRSKGTLSDGQIRWVDALCRVWIRLETDREHIRLLCNSFREYPDRALFGTRLGAQQWCIDWLA